MRDYAHDGIDIQTAMVRHFKAHPDSSKRPKSIVWDDEPLWASFDIGVPKEGRFQLEFLSEAREPHQGVDTKVEDGAITLLGGESVETLRTWNDPRYESAVEYAYYSGAGMLKVWNVYYRSWPDGRRTVEKWTGNAGFRVEQETSSCWIFRCSSGLVESPDFKQLVFRLVIKP
jgi:hypothetical protein